MPHPNHSWRLQARPVTATTPDGTTHTYPSLWQAATAIAHERHITFHTARKEIRRSIRTTHPRYGRQWAQPPPPED